MFLIKFLKVKHILFIVKFVHKIYSHKTVCIVDKNDDKIYFQQLMYAYIKLGPKKQPSVIIQSQTFL